MWTHAGLAFSADGSQVAVAQSDGVVHVYGVNSEGRRRICCRLPLGCTATCLAWAKEGNNLLFIGLISGRVRVADVAANKLGTLHEAHRSASLCNSSLLHTWMPTFAYIRESLCMHAYMHACNMKRNP